MLTIREGSLLFVILDSGKQRIWESLVVCCLLIISGTPSVVGQTNPYAPEIDVSCDLYNTQINTHPIYGYYGLVRCNLINNNNIDVNVKITWDWVGDILPYPSLSNGEEVTIGAVSGVGYDLNLLVDNYYNPGDYVFTFTTLVTSYGSGLVECQSCEEEENSWEFDVLPWIYVTDMKISSSDLDGVSAPNDFDPKCDESLDGKEKIVSFKLEVLTNTNDDLSLEVNSYSWARYVEDNGRVGDDHDDEGESFYSLETVSVDSGSISFDAKFSIDFDEERTLNSDLTFEVWLRLEHPSYILDGNYLAIEEWMERGRCQIDKNVFEDTNSTEDGAIVVNLPFASSGLTIISVALGAILFRSRHEHQ